MCRTARYAILATFLIAATGCFVLFAGQSGAPWAGAVHGALELGNPGAVAILESEGYVVGYDARTRQASWVAEKLTRESLGGRTDRTDDFRQDERVPEEFRADLLDYAGSGYDRGHMAPAGDHRRSLSEMSGTFLLSNMTPQLPALNRREWRLLEEYARDKIRLETATVCYVVSGPLWLPGDMAPQGASTTEFTVRVIGPNHVWVPTHTWKCLLYRKNQEPWKCEAYVLPNNEAALVGKGFKDFGKSVDFVEHWTGCDLFSGLPDDLERSLEQHGNE